MVTVRRGKRNRPVASHYVQLIVQSGQITLAAVGLVVYDIQVHRGLQQPFCPDGPGFPAGLTHSTHDLMFTAPPVNFPIIVFLSKKNNTYEDDGTKEEQ